MDHQDRQALQYYYRQIKILFPAYGSYEKRFFSDFKLDVEEFLLSRPDCTFSEIKEQFGAPKEIINTYLSHVDSDYLYRKIKVTKVLRKGIISCIIIVLLACLTIVGFNYANYVKSTNAIIEKQQTIIVYE